MNFLQNIFDFINIEFFYMFLIGIGIGILFFSVMYLVVKNALYNVLKKLNKEWYIHE